MSMLSRSVMRGPALWLVHVIVVLQATPALVLSAESNESVCMSLQHRVARDIREIFADMKTLVARQSPDTNDLMARLDSIDDRLDTMDGRLDSIDDRLDTMDGRLDTTDGRLDSIDNQMESFSQRYHHSIERAMSMMRHRQSRETMELVARLYDIDESLDAVESATMARLDTIDDRLESLETTQAQLTKNTMDMLSESCEDNETGLRKIFAKDSVVTVPCDGQGWMVIQRRVCNAYDFPTRPWNDYKNGFGDKAKSFWLGLEAMHQLTSANRSSVLRIELTSFQGESRHAQYASFRVEGEAEGYRLRVGEYSGTAGDSMEYHDGWRFSTVDRDQDGNSDLDCASDRKGGWWFDNCANAHLNSVYTTTGTGPKNKIIVWYHWLGRETSYKTVTMKMRWE